MFPRQNIHFLGCGRKSRSRQTWGLSGVGWCYCDVLQLQPSLLSVTFVGIWRPRKSRRTMWKRSPFPLQHLHAQAPAHEQIHRQNSHFQSCLWSCLLWVCLNAFTPESHFRSPDFSVQMRPTVPVGTARKNILLLVLKLQMSFWLPLEVPK